MTALANLSEQLFDDIAFSDSILTAAQKILANQFNIFLGRLEGTRKGEDIEDLHQMRVASRRMRSCLLHFEDAFDPETFNVHQQQLRHIGHTLGAVRDLDTGKRTFYQCLEQEGAMVEPAIHVIIDDLSQKRLAQLETVRNMLDSQAFHDWNARFTQWLAQPESDPEAPRIGHQAPGRLEQQFDEILSYRKKPETFSLRKLHKLRIRCKRFRYLAEFMRPLYDERIEQIIEKIIEFQDILGRVQDHQRDLAYLNEHFDELRQRMNDSSKTKALKRVRKSLQESIELNRLQFLAQWQVFTLKESQLRVRYLLENAVLMPTP